MVLNNHIPPHLACAAEGPLCAQIKPHIHRCYGVPAKKAYGFILASLISTVVKIIRTHLAAVVEYRVILLSCSVSREWMWMRVIMLCKLPGKLLVFETCTHSCFCSQQKDMKVEFLLEKSRPPKSSIPR